MKSGICDGNWKRMNKIISAEGEKKVWKLLFVGASNFRNPKTLAFGIYCKLFIFLVILSHYFVTGSVESSFLTRYWSNHSWSSKTSDIAYSKSLIYAVLTQPAKTTQTLLSFLTYMPYWRKSYRKKWRYLRKVTKLCPTKSLSNKILIDRVCSYISKTRSDWLTWWLVWLEVIVNKLIYFSIRKVYLVRSLF